MSLRSGKHIREASEKSERKRFMTDLDILNDTSRLVPLGVIDTHLRLPGPMPLAPDHWMWLPQWSLDRRKTILKVKTTEDHLEYLFFHNYVRLTCKPIRKKLRLRIYAIPQDTIGLSREARRKATRESKASFNHVLESIDNSLEGWHNQSAHQRNFLGENIPKNLYDLWNNLESPRIYDLPNIDPETRYILNGVLSNDVYGLETNLYEYQIRSSWKMLQRELSPKRTIDPRLRLLHTPTKTLSFKNEDNEIYLFPPLFDDTVGGILSEKMGFGKTLICIAVILATLYQDSKIPGHVIHKEKPRSMQSLVQNCIQVVQTNSVTWRHMSDLPITGIDYLKTHPAYYHVPAPEERRRSRGSEARMTGDEERVFLSHATIVISPDNLVSHWLSEIHKHTYAGALVYTVIEDKSPSVYELLEMDLVIISHSRFAKEERQHGQWTGKPRVICACDRPPCECSAHLIQYKSPLLEIHWKRIMIDEGHSMSSKISDASRLSQKLRVDRRWLISGTITPGLGVDHPDHKSEKDDLQKLGFLIGEFLQLSPYHSTSLWSTLCQEYTRGILIVKDILQRIVIRNQEKDLGVQLPPMTHKTVVLRPTSHNITSYNIFIALIASNAVTSQRTDQDYLFHQSQREHFRRLISNLYSASFWWTGTQITDLEQTIKITEKAMDNIHTYNPTDQLLLLKTLDVLRTPLQDIVWKEFSSKHHLGMYIPKEIESRWKIDLEQQIVSGGKVLELRNTVSKFAWMESEQLLAKLIENEQNFTNAEETLKLQRALRVESEHVEIKLDDDSPLLKISVSKTCSAKLNYLVEQVLEYSTQEKIIIFSEFDDVLYYTAEALEIIGIKHLIYARMKV
ncbi:F-box protein [Neolecta irregularis DAH-3]|uniref:F-box protein n=1 Tax=Neolecta irregularis (strain DAH-3) TaxID=1198029 RepID=A0A1U7LGP3_NEOID|nr:F-box protein [Neolecta irregularis DAH-3]|eukprot:OLL21825.1 F-box protein [Neolecta irregularis DAH-3]